MGRWFNISRVSRCHRAQYVISEPGRVGKKGKNDRARWRASERERVKRVQL